MTNHCTTDFCIWRTICLVPVRCISSITWGKCWKSMSHHGHWDQHPRTYSASREPTWKPTVTDRLVPVPQNYGISSQIIFGQLGVWQSSNDNWKHICSKMYLSNNYVDINIYPLTMNVMRLWACLYGKGAISNDNIIIKYLSYVYDGFCIWLTHFPGPIESVISKFTYTSIKPEF